MGNASHTSTKKTIMVVDDEAAVRQVLHDVLHTQYDVVLAPSAESALRKMAEHAPSMILLDLMMPDMPGMDLLETLHEQQSEIPVVVLTATASSQSAVQAMKLGATDYISKPFEVAELRHIVERTLNTQNLYNEVQYHRRKTDPLPAGSTMIGESPQMQEVFTRIRQVADTPSTVLITGESGTGKELVARALHFNSVRAGKPFIALNCAAIPDTLIEAELFGHEKGAFTSATGKRIGHFELADTGTIFLDELGDLALPTQAKLLRVLQEREFTRVGGSRAIRVDVRLVAATNKNLEKAMREGTFREDLYYRLNVFPINLSPLRERQGDILPLLTHFLSRNAPTGSPAKRISQDAAALLSRYGWPGNIREMENIVEQMSILSNGDTITPDDLPSQVRQRPEVAPQITENVLSGDVSFEAAVADFERSLIIRALNQTGFVQTRAAKLLGITRRVLKYKMDQLTIPARPTYSES